MKWKLEKDLIDFLEKKLNKGEKIIIETSKNGIKLSQIKPQDIKTIK